MPNDHSTAGGWQANWRKVMTFRPIIPGWELDPMNEIVVTTSATEVIFSPMQGLVNPGDEAILIEPFVVRRLS